MSSEKKRLFKKSMFGFRKKDVLEYLDTLNDETLQKMQNFNEQIEELRVQNAALRFDIAEFTASRTQFSNDCELLAQTMLSAKEAANKMVDDAKAEITQKRTEFQQSYAAEINKLASIRNEIIQLRNFTTQAIRDFEQKLSHLERESLNLSNKDSESLDYPPEEN